MEQRQKKDTHQYAYCFKTVLSFKEGCRYCDISESSMYKHTSNGTVPYYKPHGKLIFFKREDLDNWMLQNRHSSKEELEDEAVSKSFKADWRNKFKS